MSQETPDPAVPLDDAHLDPADAPICPDQADEQTTDPTTPLDSLDQPEPKPKRNCGRCGATTAAGRARSALNATKHGSCAWTLILPTESEEGWNILLNLFLKRYPADENTLEYRYVLKTAQAEWQRIRCENNYNSFLATTSGLAPYNWKPEQIHQHDLLLRYKTAAERTFQRTNNQLEQHFKTHKPEVAPQPEPSQKPETAPEPPPIPRTKLLFCDPTSPTGYSYRWEFPPREGVTYPCPAPPPTSQRLDPPGSP